MGDGSATAKGDRPYTGKWALVTGASSGIGAAFARELAARGADVALTARRAERLAALAVEIEAAHGVKTLVVPADLKKPEAPAEVLARLAGDGARVDILVNNAGYGLSAGFLDFDWDAHRDFLEVMVSSYAHFIHLTLGDMKARGWGRVVQVGSVAGLTPGSAGGTMYGASKAFVASFTQSVAAEARGSGVLASALCPGFVYTEIHDVAGTRDVVSKLPKWMFMEAGPVVAGALDALERDHTVYVPGAWNKFLCWLARTLPRSWAEEIVVAQSKRFRR